MTIVGESIVEFIIIKQKKIYQYIQNWCECFCKMFFGKNDDTSVHFTWPQPCKSSCLNYADTPFKFKFK